MPLSIPLKKKFISCLNYLAIIIVLTLVLWPIAWMLSTAFKVDSKIFIIPPRWIPEPISLEHFRAMLSEKYFFNFYLNSILVSSSTVLLSLIVSVPASYVFSRFKLKGGQFLQIFFLTSQMIPWSLLVISLYIIFFRFHLLNSLLGLVLAHTTLTLPFIVWMMKGFFDTIPRELDEAAYVDGCGRYATLFQIIIPLASPGIITAGIYAFLVSWNDFLFGLTLMTRQELRTLPAGIAMSYIGQFQYRWGDMMASSLTVSLPLVLAFIFLQNSVVKGLTTGAVKG